MRFGVEKQFFVKLLLSAIILKARTALNRFNYILILMITTVSKNKF